MTPRLATTDDLIDIVNIHLQAWQETYPGLVPPSEFENRNRDQRLTLWGRILQEKQPVSYLPGIGFAHMGPNRNTDYAATYPGELYSFYTLKHAHGTGAAQALLRHATQSMNQPFVAEVLQGNDRATAFYEKIGGRRLEEIPEVLDGWNLTTIVFGYENPPRLD